MEYLESMLTQFFFISPVKIYKRNSIEELKCTEQMAKEYCTNIIQAMYDLKSIQNNINILNKKEINLYYLIIKNSEQNEEYKEIITRQEEIVLMLKNQINIKNEQNKNDLIYFSEDTSKGIQNQKVLLDILDMKINIQFSENSAKIFLSFEEEKYVTLIYYFEHNRFVLHSLWIDHPLIEHIKKFLYFTQDITGFIYHIRQLSKQKTEYILIEN